MPTVSRWTRARASASGRTGPSTPPASWAIPTTASPGCSSRTGRTRGRTPSSSPSMPTRTPARCWSRATISAGKVGRPCRRITSRGCRARRTPSASEPGARDNARMSELTREILDTFDALFADALDAGEPDRTAMTLATADASGRPSARTVLLKAHDPRGFVFYTHLDGRKGRELQANPRAALLFHWPRVRQGVQVRVEGTVEIVDDAEADAYFASRPRGSQLGAWASVQSETLASREAFETHLAEVAARFDDRDVPRPLRWSGFRIVPRTVEFWYGGAYRLHERYLHEASDDGTWSTRMLQP